MYPSTTSPFAAQNIAALLENLHGGFQRLRQTTIDEELFDVVSGFEAQGGAGKHQ